MGVQIYWSGMPAKRKTPIKERAAKAGVAIAPTPTGVRDILVDEGASPAARTCAKKALRAHQMGVVMKVTRAEENAQRPPSSKRSSNEALTRHADFGASSEGGRAAAACRARQAQAPKIGLEEGRTGRTAGNF